MFDHILATYGLYWKYDPNQELKQSQLVKVVN